MYHSSLSRTLGHVPFAAGPPVETRLLSKEGFEMSGFTLFLIASVVFAALLVAVWLWFSAKKKQIEAAEQEQERRKQERLRELPSVPLSDRRDDAVYQWSYFHGDRVVARVVGAEIDDEAREVTFVELTHSDLLFLVDPCEFGKYKIEIDTVGDAMKVDKSEPEKGRILRQVKGRITGYVEQ